MCWPKCLNPEAKRTNRAEKDQERLYDLASHTGRAVHLPDLSVRVLRSWLGKIGPSHSDPRVTTGTVNKGFHSRVPDHAKQLVVGGAASGIIQAESVVSKHHLQDFAIAVNLSVANIAGEETTFRLNVAATELFDSFRCAMHNRVRGNLMLIGCTI
jgi:hypothetical protein